jgi:hypothetical protein
VPYGSAPDIFDLFRFTSAGTRLFSGSNTAPAAYFSVDGGNTKLADFGRTSDSAISSTAGWNYMNRRVREPGRPSAAAVDYDNIVGKISRQRKMDFFW